MFLEALVPRRLEVSGEIRVARAHPRNLVKEDHRAPDRRNRGVKSPKRFRPVLRRRHHGPCLVGKLCAEVFPLREICHAFAWRKADNVDEVVGGAPRELLHKRALADSPAPTARHKRRRTLPPQLGKRLQLLFSSYEHVTILHWEMAALYQIATRSASELGVN